MASSFAHGACVIHQRTGALAQRGALCAVLCAGALVRVGALTSCPWPGPPHRRHPPRRSRASGAQRTPPPPWRSRPSPWPAWQRWRRSAPPRRGAPQLYEGNTAGDMRRISDEPGARNATRALLRRAATPQRALRCAPAAASALAIASVALSARAEPAATIRAAPAAVAPRQRGMSACMRLEGRNRATARWGSAWAAQNEGQP